MNVEPMIAATAGWLLTVALHGGLFLLAAWLIDRTWRAPPNAWRELIWRVALFGGVITASMQPIAGPSPIAARWQLADATAPAAITSAATGAWAADTQSMSVGPPVAARHSIVSTAPASATDSAAATPGTASPARSSGRRGCRSAGRTGSSCRAAGSRAASPGSLPQPSNYGVRL